MLLDLLEKIETNSHKAAYLSKTTPLDSLPEGLRNELEKMYGSKSITARVLATIINSSYTEKRLVFLFSLRLINKLLEADGKGNLSGQDYKCINAFFLHENILEVDRGVVKGKRVSKVVTLNKEIRNEIKKYLPEITPEQWSIQYKETVAVYDRKTQSLGAAE